MPPPPPGKKNSSINRVRTQNLFARRLNGAFCATPPGLCTTPVRTSSASLRAVGWIHPQEVRPAARSRTESGSMPPCTTAVTRMAWGSILWFPGRTLTASLAEGCLGIGVQKRIEGSPKLAIQSCPAPQATRIPAAPVNAWSTGNAELRATGACGGGEGLMATADGNIAKPFPLAAVRQCSRGCVRGQGGGSRARVPPLTGLGRAAFAQRSGTLAIKAHWRVTTRVDTAAHCYPSPPLRGQREKH